MVHSEEELQSYVGPNNIPSNYIRICTTADRAIWVNSTSANTMGKY